jgi:hypothetical protein
VIAVSLLLWHVAFAGLSAVLHQLSVRLGRALADNDRYLPLYLVGAVLLLGSGILWTFQEVMPRIALWAPVLDLVGGGCSAVAAWSYWSWLPGEIRKTREG